MEYLPLILIALLPPILIGLYLYFRDKYVKEPVRLLLLSYGSGWSIVVFLLIIHSILVRSPLQTFFEGVFPPSTLAGSFFDAFIMAALLEELAKFIVFRKIIWGNKHFDEYFDGILYAALISLGFASLENIMYVMEYGFSTGISRAFTAIPAHTFFGITMGYYFSMAKFSHTNTMRNLVLALLIPIVLHGLYDFILFELYRMEDSTDPLYVWISSSFWIIMIFMLVWSRRKIKRMLKKDASVL